MKTLRTAIGLPSALFHGGADPQGGAESSEIGYDL